MNRLMMSEKALKGLADCLPDATLVIDMEGKVVIWNKAMERLTGIKPKICWARAILNMPWRL